MPDDPTNLDVVRLAAQWHPLAGWHAAEAWRRWRLTGPRFYQRLGVALVDADVEREMPVEVHRLRRQRDAAQKRRRVA